MYPKTYLFQVPDRVILLIISPMPFITRLNHYLIQGTTLGEVLIMLIIFSFLFSLAYYFMTRRYSITIEMNYFETKKRRYRPDDISKLKLYRRSGFVIIKMNGYVDSRKLRFHKGSLPEAIDVMTDWAISNKVVHKIYKR